VELQGRLDDIRKAGMNIAAISYDPVSVLDDFARRRQIAFPLLSDAGSATIKRYGILNTTVDSTNPLYGYPFPGTFILDRHGIVRSRVFEPIYQERSTISSVMVRLGGRIDAPATTIKGAHVNVTSITGTFEYQACDDKVCFTPQSVPLSWTVAVKPLDLERAKRR
jgi:hypothetical protein